MGEREKNMHKVTIIRQLVAKYEIAQKNLIVAYLRDVAEIAGINAVRATVRRRCNLDNGGDIDDMLSIDVTFYDEQGNDWQYTSYEPYSDEADGLIPIMYILDDDTERTFDLAE